MSKLGLKKAHYTPLEESPEDGHFMHPAEYEGHLHHSLNPDQFFKDIYNYHQAGGFWALLLAELLWITKFVFVVFVGIELSACTRWDVLANNNAVVTDWDDVFTPPGQCWTTLSLIPALFVTGTVFTLFFQIVRTIRRLQRYWAIRQFCTKVLSMPVTSTGLSDLTWVDVQRRLIDSKVVPSLDELSICHRILRHENYLISMVDQDILPIRFTLPITTPPWPYIFLSDGYLLNLRLILFNTPWSPFSTHWRLRSEYKEFPKRYQLANQLATMSRVLGLLNLLFAPAIVLAQLLVFLCSNAERLRYQPGSIMGRRWSNYAKLYLRHYNELSHQFAMRIGMAYESACQYLDCFISRNLIALAETGAFIFGSASVAFFLMGIIHEQMMHLTGYWAILVAGGLLARACVSFIPDENVIHSPQVLLITILGKIHRVRDHWIEHGGTYRVCAEFAQLFQYQLSAAFEEIFSAVITPFLLLFVVPHHTIHIVDFLRNYTVELPDLGDVCSFAQMDVRRHGDPQWRPDTYEDERTGVSHKASEHESHMNTTDGKIELSLMHFHLNNPNYNLPEPSRAYLMAIRRQLLRDIQQPLVQPTPDLNGQPFVSGGLGSLISPTSLLTSLYGGQSSIQQSLVHRAAAVKNPYSQLKKVSHLPGPCYIPGDTLGFVGAVAQSMRVSMHRSDPGMERSSKSDSTIYKGLSSVPQDPAIPRTTDDRKPDHSGTVQTVAVPDASPGPVSLTRSVNQPVLEQSMLAYPPPSYTADPINMSWMAASALFSVDGSGHPGYRPYVSQMDNGSSQHWGVASSIFGYANSRYGLADVLTADTSASILYMHELAHRRRQQQQQLSAGSGPLPLAGSSSGGPWEVRSSGVPHPTGGILASNLPYQHLPTGSSSGGGGGGVAVQLPSATRYSVNSGARPNLERPGPSTSRYGYGSTCSTVTTESGGVIRTSLDSRRIPRAAFAEIAEEDEQPVSTPRLNTETHFHPYHLASEVSNSPAGVVTVPNVPLPRMRRTSADLSVGPEPEAIQSDMLTGDTDTEHVWPDLPPTNC